MNSDNFKEGFSKLGSRVAITNELLKFLEEFTCKLYVSQTDICKINNMHY